jgi:hypothetical protein
MTRSSTSRTTASSRKISKRIEKLSQELAAVEKQEMDVYDNHSVKLSNGERAIETKEGDRQERERGPLQEDIGVWRLCSRSTNTLRPGSTR